MYYVASHNLNTYVATYVCDKLCPSNIQFCYTCVNVCMFVPRYTSETMCHIHWKYTYKSIIHTYLGFT